MEDDSDGSDQNEFFLCDTWNANQCDNLPANFQHSGRYEGTHIQRCLHAGKEVSGSVAAARRNGR